MIHTALPAPPCPPIDAAVTLRATEWMVALLGADATAQARADCANWRAEHPDHERAWQHLHAFSAALGNVPTAVARSALDRSGPSHPARRRALMLAVATLGAAGAWQLQRAMPLPTWGADHVTGIGERRQVRLADGTRVDLDTGSAIAVDYSDTERRVTLRAGAIAIETGSDPRQRPFRVATAQGLLRALGTRFTVRQEDGITAVSVQHGAVEVRPTDAPDVVAVLRAGERTRFTRLHIDTPEPADSADAAWTQGMLAVYDMRLDAFLTELSRYRRGRLACNEAAAGLRISGVFPLDDTDRIVAALPHLLPVDVQMWTRYWVLVRG
ncbi:FecR domain-containing protein [Cupriavidus agavae]|uniref:FecR family protein n=1 Tax=Cupriavidus agavae TaxID=1001822 RepID=A0A4Q7RF99_9BURK|nr:FecR domain-containing protein [Cupriavidus agavae]RZT30770.1 FecR family protein [Cupriavidus agavae]